MLRRWQWRLIQLTKQVWFRATMYSVFGVAAALLALVLTPLVPDEIPAEIGSDAVDSILSIIASSMLAVTTFSLSTMVSAYGGATSNVTPRATMLLVEDPTSQKVLSTFVGAFLFSLVGIIALSTGLYGEKGRFLLFLATLALIVLIVASLLRWIDYLTHFGRVGDTTKIVEAAACRALTARRERPYLGGIAALAAPPARGRNAVTHPQTGYVQHVDMAALQELAERLGAEIDVLALPGSFLDPGRAIAALPAGAKDADLETVRAAFTVGDARSFEQDPRFGMSVLSEIASRALSPAVNDPGTAIDVIGRAVRLLLVWSERTAAAEPDFPRVRVPAITLDELFDDTFTPIARDGAGLVEVQIRLQKALSALSRCNDPRFAGPAARHAQIALSRARRGLSEPEDLRRVEAAMD